MSPLKGLLPPVYMDKINENKTKGDALPHAERLFPEFEQKETTLPLPRFRLRMRT